MTSDIFVMTSHITLQCYINVTSICHAVQCYDCDTTVICDATVLNNLLVNWGYPVWLVHMYEIGMK